MKEQIYYSWDDLGKDLLLINSRMHLDGWLPSFIVGIKRGGLIPAVALSHLFREPMNIITYQSRDGTSNLDLSELFLIEKEAKILIVDDICDTGETFNQIKDKTQEYKNIKFCSLFYNIRQGFMVDYFSRKIDRDKDLSWIVFPWELLK